MTTERVVRTSELSVGELARVRALLVDAFRGAFSDDDWQHTLGGWHVLVLRDDQLVAHAAVVPRELRVGGVPVRAGYVEGVATRGQDQRTGLGSRAMREVATLLHSAFEMGALSTGSPAFYEHLGWQRWRGPTFVRGSTAEVRTPEEDDGVMVLRYGPSSGLDLYATISCDERAGDDW